MIKNYFKIAWRNLKKNKVYSFINIGGLAVGMAVAMLIGLWIYDEFSANKHFKNYKTLYQVKMHQTFDGHRGTQDALPYPMGQELKTKFPDFKSVAMCDWGKRNSFAYQNKNILQDGNYIGEEAIDMFSFKILKGDKNPLHEPYSIVLTDEAAKNFFGDENPIGKILKMDNAYNLKVTAIVAKQPHNSFISFDYLLPWHLQESINPDIKKETWGNNSYRVFVQLSNNASYESANAKIKNVAMNHFLDNKLMLTVTKPEVIIHPMAKWRLYSEFENAVNTGGFIKYVKMFGILGLIVLIIACINFMNLSTARSEKRAKEVGIRKAIGSLRGQLVAQFLSESMLISNLAFVLAMGMVAISISYFNDLAEKELTLQLTNPVFWGIIIAFTLLTGLLAGSYPAFYLSSFNPISVLKGNVKVGKGGALPRKILVDVQFASSVVLMIGTIIIYQQIELGKNRPIGFNKNGLISVNWSAEIDKNFVALQQELINSGAVSSITKSNSPPTQIWSNNNGWEWRGSQPEDQGLPFNTIATEYDYTKTMGIKMLEGRDFSKDFSTDSSAVILNQAAVKRMGLKHPIGEILKWRGQTRTVVGVVPDIQMESPYRPISPLTIVFDKYWVNQLCVRINPDIATSAAIEKMKPIFDKYNPAFPFEYKFTDDE